MTEELKSNLLAWWQERTKHESTDRRYVFVCLDRTAFCEEYYGKPFKVRQHFMQRLCEKAGVKPFGFHAIRHLTVSILFHKGVDIADIQAILRHKNPNTTARYLRSIGLEHTRKALEENIGQVLELPKKETLSKI